MHAARLLDKIESQLFNRIQTLAHQNKVLLFVDFDNVVIN